MSNFALIIVMTLIYPFFVWPLLHIVYGLIGLGPVLILSDPNYGRIGANGRMEITIRAGQKGPTRYQQLISHHFSRYTMVLKDCVTIRSQ